MSKYTVTFSCGHEEEHQIYGPTKEREGKAEWLGRGLCKACYGAHQAAELAAASIDLPPLQGSDKQIAWATAVRVKIIAAYDEHIAAQIQRAKSKTIDPDEIALFETLAATVRSRLVAQAAAAWWIDRRDVAIIKISRELSRDLVK